MARQVLENFPGKEATDKGVSGQGHLISLFPYLKKIDLAEIKPFDFCVNDIF